MNIQDNEQFITQSVQECVPLVQTCLSGNPLRS